MSNDITWLFGIEKYFHFINDVEKKKFIRNIINLCYSGQDSKPWSLKLLMVDDYEKYPEKSRENRLTFYTTVCAKNTVSTVDIMNTMRSIWPKDDLIEKLNAMLELGYENILSVIFGKSQVQSKIWLAEVLYKYDLNFNHILLIGGWLTHHSLYLKDINYNKLFSIDPDKKHNELIKIINPEALVLNKDVNKCIDADGDIMFDNKILEPSLVINTSAEHMTDEWFHRIKPGTRVLIQSNSSPVEDDHINYAEDIAEFLQKYKMSNIFYRGETRLTKYTRFMIYGEK